MTFASFARARTQTAFGFTLPMVGEVEIEIFGVTRGRTWFDMKTDYPCGSRAFWAGPVHLIFSPCKPRLNTAQAWLLVALVGWTEGRLWQLPLIG